MKRYSTTMPNVEKSKNINEWQGRQKAQDKESITDTDAYTPLQMTKIVSGAGGQGIYDFKDGKDTGFRPYRDIGADITEIQENIESIKGNIEEKVKEQKDKIKEQENLKERTKIINETIKQQENSGGQTEA